MPLGVEHGLNGTDIMVSFSVFKPLMPLGVEHIVAIAPLKIFVRVFKPLMPLGVEHLTHTYLPDPFYTCLNL